MIESLIKFTCDKCKAVTFIKNNFINDNIEDVMPPDGWRTFVKNHCQCEFCRQQITTHICPKCCNEPCSSCKGRTSKYNPGDRCSHPIKATKEQKKNCKFLIKTGSKLNKFCEGCQGFIRVHDKNGDRFKCPRNVIPTTYAAGNTKRRKCKFQHKPLY